jgi:hypothetical protein
MAFVSLIRPESQIRSSRVYNDGIAPSLANFETNPADQETDLNNIRSAISNLIDGQTNDWYTDLNTPATLETGTQRGVNDLNTDLHAVEKKRVLRDVVSIVPITVGAGNNFVILGAGELPANTTAAVGVVTTLGTVVAFHAGTFGTHSLDEVVGSSAVSPINLVTVIDDVTHDVLTSGGNQIYGLLQSETVTDGHTITDTTTTRVQISFVRINGAGNDLEAVPFADIENEVIHYFPVERVRLEDLTEQDFLTGRIIDVPTGTTVTRQVAYTGQGATPVDLVTNATLDLEGAGLAWSIRDDLEASLFSIVEGSAGGTSQFNIHAGVDEYDNDAVVANFASGVTMNSGGTRPLQVGVNDGLIETTAGNMEVKAFAEISMNDGNRSGSTWSLTTGMLFSATSAEWSTFETNYGEVSLLNAMNQASGSTPRQVARATLTADAAAGVNVSGTTATVNLDGNLLDYDAVNSESLFESKLDVFVNQGLLEPDFTASGNDYQPGTDPTFGDLKFSGDLFIGDVIQMIGWF